MLDSSRLTSRKGAIDIQGEFAWLFCMKLTWLVMAAAAGLLPLLAMEALALLGPMDKQQ